MSNYILNFGGFYESIHSGLVECAVENLFEDDEGNFDHDGFDNYNFREAFNQYAEEYVNKISEVLSHDMGLDVDIKFVELISPRFYNFTTDKIEVSISDRHCDIIIGHVIDNYHDEVMELVIDSTTSRSGYIPFYSFDEVMNTRELMMQIVLEVFCNYYNEEELIDGIFSMVPLEFLY